MKKCSALLLSACLGTLSQGWTNAASANGVSLSPQSGSTASYFNVDLVTPQWQSALHNFANWAQNFPDQPAYAWSNILRFIDLQHPDPEKLAYISPLIDKISQKFANAPSGQRDFLLNVEKIRELSSIDQSQVLDSLDEAADLAAVAIQTKFSDAQISKGIMTSNDLTLLKERLDRSRAVQDQLRNIVDAGIYTPKIGPFLERSQNKFATIASQLQSRIEELNAEKIVAQSGIRQPSIVSAKPPTEAPSLAYSDPRMQEVSRLIQKIGPTPHSVLIQGETGVGKELVARELHEKSNVPDKTKFIPINVAALPSQLLTSELFGYQKGAFTGAYGDRAGLFRAASGGTLFLDEIGELAPDDQAKLLRALQTGEILPLGSTEIVRLDPPPRIIAATNKDLGRAVKDGTFREDLYFRLNVLEIRIPPLRDRRQDILPLAYYFLNHLNPAGSPIKILSNFVQDAILSYEWPGNVRELENRIHRAILLSDGNIIYPKDLDLPDNLAIQSPRKIEESGTMSHYLSQMVEATPQKRVLASRIFLKNKVLDKSAVELFLEAVLDLIKEEHLRLIELGKKYLGSRATLYRALKRIERDFPELAGKVEEISSAASQFGINRK